SRAEVEEDAGGNRGGDKAAEQLQKARSNQVANTFRVVHDTRHKRAGLGVIEVANRKPLDVLLNPEAQLRDRVLRSHAEELGERVVAKSADSRGERRDGGEFPQQIELLIGDD